MTQTTSLREVDRVADLLSRGDRNFERRWLSAKQRDWLYGAWLRSGGPEVGGSFPNISGTLADGAHWNAALFRGGKGGCQLSVGPSAAEMERERQEAMNSTEYFF